MKESIIKVIAYFDVFNYPIRFEEIKIFLDKVFDEKSFTDALQQLLDEKVIWQLDEFYSLQNDMSLVERRLKGNQAATKEIRKAKRIARFLSWFPYIRGIAISGSLSKHFVYKGSDFDFFIITAPNRLWVTKFFLTPILKLAGLFKFRHWFCINYSIDEIALEIVEKNIFTAIEIVTLIPCRGEQMMKSFYKTNQWVYEYFPNCTLGQNTAKKIPITPIKVIIEWMFNNKIGDKLDDALVRFFDMRWKKLLAKKQFGPKGHQLGACTAYKHCCKPFPKHFQQRILDTHNEKVEKIIYD